MIMSELFWLLNETSQSDLIDYKLFSRSYASNLYEFLLPVLLARSATTIRRRSRLGACERGRTQRQKTKKLEATWLRRLHW